MTKDYDGKFFDWVGLTARRSARRAIPILQELAKIDSVADVGCGEGAWLQVWKERGVHDLRGFDGGYVDLNRLAINREQFTPVDLAASLSVERRYGLVQSLEVGEHLPPARASSFVRDLCRLGDVVLFSAAQPGQGGERHVNERKVSWWASLFHENGYAAFDCLRPPLRSLADVDPWYRFNAVVYANEEGVRRLSAEALATRCDNLLELDRVGDLAWKVRCALLRPLPVSAVSFLSRLRYRAVCAIRARAA